MNKIEKSSRRRMQGRVRKYVKTEPAMFYRLDPKTQVERQQFNRAARRRQNVMRVSKLLAN
jgi:hypothetical protein